MQIYYAASDAKDALGKDIEHVHMIFDRDHMWDSTNLYGSSSVYEVAGLSDVIYDSNGVEYNISKRFLPCPCQNCINHNNFHLCSNVHIVGIMEFARIDAIASTVIPDLLQEPLNNYKVIVLKKFLQKHKIATGKDNTRKIKLIELIHTHLKQFVKEANYDDDCNDDCAFNDDNCNSDINNDCGGDASVADSDDDHNYDSDCNDDA